MHARFQNKKANESIDRRNFIFKFDLGPINISLHRVSCWKSTSKKGVLVKIGVLVLAIEIGMSAYHIISTLISHR